MVSANLKGGLGNYMFQIATAHTLAVRNNDIAKFNFASAMQVHKNVEHYKSNIFRNVISGECELFWQWDEPTFTFNEIPYKNGLLLNGYFQSEKYLDRDETLKLFEKANFYTEYVLKKQMQSPFKDIRKISVGLSNKDIISYRKKKKGAFYNCFVIIMRIKIDNENYKECHVKIFNTGKIEIPGIKHNTLLKKVLNNILILLNDLNIVDIDFKDTIETVLINSNFNCGYSINRDKLAKILKQKYSLNVSYDPCSYPGIMCKFYYDKFDSKTNGIENKNKKSCFLISFMIFRTGSILVVGKATEKVLYYIYNFIKNILNNEFREIYNNSVIQEKTVVRKKIRKKQIIISA